LVVAGCTGSHPDRTATKHLPPAPATDPASVTVETDTTTTVAIGGGAHLIIPPGAMPSGTVVHATYKNPPGGQWGSLSPLRSPIHLTTEPANAIHGLLTLEFPAPAGYSGAGGQFGISTYRDDTQDWVPVDSRYDAARHMIVAQIEHFSWWNPFSWDWASLFARVNQRIGQIIGKRADASKCTRGQRVPSWVKQLAGVTNEPAVAIRSCAEGEDGVLAVELRNNRPYSMYLHYGSAVKWGWHEKGSSADDIARNALGDRLAGKNELYLPPLGRASIGILKTSGLKQFQAGFGYRSLGVDALAVVLGNLVGKIPRAGTCLEGLFETPVPDFSPGMIRDGVVKNFNCVVKEAARAGYFDDATISELKSFSRSLTVAGFVLTMGDYEWKFLDLFVDGVVVEDTGLGAGFSVWGASSTTVTSPPPKPAFTPSPRPTPTSSSPSPTSPATHSPVKAYNNYGSTNSGHAMCRGNPSVTASMPGGTVSQTFTVPAGVATLSSALVQIDPDARVTAHLSLAVNGTVRASTTAAAAGDTRFKFAPVPVSAGQTVRMSINFTATYGKIITIYSVGHPGGTFSASNSCPDGAPSFSTTSTGLRAVVYGLS
jgi:hypothetical protein